MYIRLNKITLMSIHPYELTWIMGSELDMVVGWVSATLEGLSRFLRTQVFTYITCVKR